MSINLQHNTNRKITVISSKKLYPKSFRLSQHELEALNQFKEKIEHITNSHSCSDTKVFKILLNIASNTPISSIHKALGKIL